MAVSKKNRAEMEQAIRERSRGLVSHEETPKTPSMPWDRGREPEGIYRGLPEPEIEWQKDAKGEVKKSEKTGRPIERRHHVTLPLPANYIRMLDTYFRTKGLNRTNGLREMVLEFMRENQIDDRYDIHR